MSLKRIYYVKKMKERGVYRLELEHQLDSLINALDDRPDYNKGTFTI